MKLLTGVFLFGFSLLAAGCGGGGGGGGDADTPDQPLSDFFRPIPQTPAYPDDNPYSAEKEALGELLFWDPILSGDQNVACASCHHPAHAWGDGRSRSVGSDGVGLGPARTGAQVTEFNSPTVLNSAFAGLGTADSLDGFVAGPFFWDARAPSLEDQALEPIMQPVEMLGFNHAPADALALGVTRLGNIPEYVALFDDAFDDPDPITAENVARALATFQRKLITPPTRFDRFLEGDTASLSEREIEGLNKFVNVGCARCHNGVMLSDFEIHANQPVLRGLPAVRTAPLRNVTLTGPFMHNGTRATLTDAIEEYDDRNDLQVDMGGGDVGDIRAFLLTLTSASFYSNIPTSVPSGLAVGGDIN